MKVCVKKGLYCMKSQKPTKSVLGDLLFLIENNKFHIEIWPSYYITIIHNHQTTTELPISHLHTSMCSVYNISLKYE